jgi:hypothetical protein
MIRALCAEYRVQCRFVWQPTFFNYDRALHPLFPYPGEVPKFWAEAYDRIRLWKAPDVLYLGDMFEAVREKVFVDNVHYNERPSTPARSYRARQRRRLHVWMPRISAPWSHVSVPANTRQITSWTLSGADRSCAPYTGQFVP